MVKIGNHEFKAHLIPLDIHHFYAILWMGWLATQHASINYFIKEVSFRSRNQPEITYLEERQITQNCLVSILISKKMLIIV